MPIHIQKSGLPAVRCDHCLEPIKDEGNVLWMHGEDTTFYFTHKDCNREFEMAQFTETERHKENSQPIAFFFNSLVDSINDTPKAKK